MRRLVLLVAFTALWITAAAPSFAWAAEVPTATASGASELLDAGAIDVQWWMEAEPGQAIAIVSTTIGTSVNLPVRVRLPIPPGMSVDWAGEVSGADATQDVQRQFSVQQGEGAQYAEFEVTTYRAAQIDLSGVPLTPDGDRVSASLEFVQSVPSLGTAFTVRLPAGATDAKIEPAPEGSPSTNEDGETLYTLPAARPKLGESSLTQVSYLKSSGALSSPASPAAQRSSQLVAVLAALAVAALVALAVAVRRQRSAGAVTPTPDRHGEAAVRRKNQRRAEAPDDVDSDEPFLLDD